MRVSRNFEPSGKEDAKYRITFELTKAELLDGGWYTRFSEMWEHSRMAKDYLEFLAKFAGIIGLSQPPNFEQLGQEAANHAAQAKAERIRQQFAGFQQQHAYYSFDFGGFGGDFSFNDQPAEPAWAKVLGLPKTATKQEIKAKYRELAKLHHPDKPGGNAKKFAEITNAYEEAIR